ncbi:hypothetical protein [Bacillus cereus group sp. BfR-BA-01383]|uniref:hypothetical protein n=1 Tax=Bacillus cereus group sp. BfR-BA-01383 TaxID=2920327 RepID=UPI001F567984|nr:hypothetical protein [Bacillus cereus group sp. BfR-BA-01383]
MKVQEGMEDGIGLNSGNRSEREHAYPIYHFSQEDSFLKEREVSRWEMNWLRTRDSRKPP